MTAKKDKDKKKEKPLPDPYCDWKGKCKKKGFAEVYPFDINASREKGYPVFIDKGWSYLCLFHFIIVIIRGDTVAWCEVDDLTNIQKVIVKYLDKVVSLYAIIREIKYFLNLYLHAEIIYLKEKKEMK